MKLERFLDERAPEWAALEALVHRADHRGAPLSPVERRELALRHRSAAADLAVARRWFPNTPGTFRLQALLARSHGVVYGRATAGFGFGEFVTARFWRRVRESGRCLAISAAVLVGFTVAACIWALIDPAAAAGVLPGQFHPTSHPGQGGVVGIAVEARAGVAFSIFVNNIVVTAIAVAGGFTLGVITVASLAYNGVILGALAGLEFRAGSWEQFVRLVVPHGLLELSCIVVAGSAGLQIARALIDPGRRSHAEALDATRPLVIETAAGVFGCLVVAGLTEGIVTTWDLPIGLALAVGVALAGAFWTLVLVRGRPEPAPAGALAVTTGRAA